jgi:hypothetical protein
MTHRRLFASCVALLLSSGLAMVMVNCNTGDTAMCTAGYERCACAENNACLTGLTCLSSVCVNASTSSVSSSSSSSGSSGDAGTGGATDGGAKATSSSSAASGGGGDAGPTTPCGPNVIDDFSTCDTSICNVGGRSGTWQTVLAPNATETFMVSDPPSPWNDMTCAAWTTGPSGAASVGFGTQLAGGSPYSLSPWGGMTLLIESSNDTFLQLKAADGGTFQVNIPGMAGTSVPHSIRFTDLQYVSGTGGSTTLDLTQITDLQLMADVNMGFGYALHSVVLDD